MTEYEALLARLVKGAEYLDNPLIKPEDYEKGRKLYDAIERAIDLYREREDARAHLLPAGNGDGPGVQRAS